MPLARFHPVSADWFRARLGAPTEPQDRAWPEIAEGRDTLIAAPTGSGKTLAAFFWCLDSLFQRGLAAGGVLEDRTDVLYISPLKALGNDVRKNLEEPLAGIRARALERGLPAPEVRVSVRSGDTPAAERRRMASKPPHILVTTPESAFILATSESGRRALAGVRTVIVDEIHAVIGDKRGAHLALTLERVERLVRAAGGRRPVRIGLSATQEPIDEVARFLVGTGRIAAGRPDCAIVDVGRRRDLDLAVIVPEGELGAVASNEMWAETYDRIAALAAEHRTTIVFVNTRRLVERVGHRLRERMGEGAVAVHHGSLSRRTRLFAEERLKRGEVRLVVATASLELGIDIGAVDLVCQVGSPRAIRTFLQRVGRSGHKIGSTPKGRLFALTRDQLVECAALVRAARAGVIDRLAIRRAPLDILAQQVVAMAACEDWDEDALFAAVRGAYPYAELAREEFEAVLAMLAEGVALRRGRSAAHIHRDLVNRRVRGRRGARIAAITSGGAIPDVADYDVVAEPEGTFIGKVDEDFAVESMAGDIFLLGNTSWQIVRVEAGRLRVADAHGAAPGIPFWRAEAPARTDELSKAVSELRAAVEARLGDREAAIALLEREGGLPRAGAEQALSYLAASCAVLGAVPTAKRIVAERFFDDAGGMQLVIHAPFGGRVNRAWGLALRKRFCRSFDFELQAAATDDGIVLSLGPQHSFPLETVFRFLHPNTVRALLEQAVLAAPMFGTRWRWNATRALALLRTRGGRKVPAPIQRIRAEDLLAAVFPGATACLENHAGDIEIPDHPLVRETLRDCFEEAMDLDGLVAVLRAIHDGAIETVARDVPEPSLMSHEVLNSNPYSYLDDAPLEERRARAVALRRGLPVEVARELGALDPEAIALVESEARPEPRDADELHDALLTMGALPEAEAAPWRGLADALVAGRRAAWLVHERGRVLVAAERVPLARAAYGGASLEPAIEAPRGVAGDVAPEEAVATIVRGVLACSGPATAEELSARLGLPLATVEAGLARVESEGQVLRGRFRPAPADGAREVEWCDRGLLARIHRLTIGKLRREIEPVSTADFLRFLLRWQHVAPGTQLHGEEGVLRVIEQLQGFQAAAGAWEDEILRARIGGYRPEWLDALCLSGEVAWGRLDAPRAAGAAIRAAAPIGVALRDALPWLVEGGDDRPAPEGLSHAARDVLEYLRRRGASFLPELVAGSGRLRTEVDEAVRELVAAGLVTADGFQALRSLLARPELRRRAATRARRTGGPRRREAQGRWSLFRAPAPPPPAAEVAERFARQLLARYGVVCRDILGRESRAPGWRDLLLVYRRLEARGEVRGGRFVAGAPGEHFALPAAVEALRAVRRAEPRGETVRVAASDPLNLAGILTPGPRIAAGPGRGLVYREGVPEVLEPAAGRGAAPLEAVPRP